MIEGSGAGYVLVTNGSEADPEGQKTYGSYGSGSGCGSRSPTLVLSLTKNLYWFLFF
jgi:hypothetical protein